MFPLSVSRFRPLEAAQSFAVLSVPPVASSLPSGDQATELTAPACALQSEPFPIVDGLPHLRGPIGTRRCQMFGVRRPRHRQNVIDVPVEREPLATVGCFPQYDRSIRAARCHELPVW